jgi:hypothetical protein
MNRTTLATAALLILWTGVLRAQSENPMTAYDRPASNRVSSEQLDQESFACMTCHNGTLGPRIEIRAAGSPIEYEFTSSLRTTNHAVGMEYRLAYEAKPREFVAPAALAPSIRLVAGKVGCLSCHIKKTDLVAETTPTLPDRNTRCTIDRAENGRFLGGPNCLQCHRK